LLPTLRAAADPVTRDLYVSRVSEVLGISPSSIAREIQLGSGISTAPRAPAPAVGEPAPPPRRAGRPTPERNLLRVMVHHPEWRSRVLELIGDMSVVLQPERELMEMLGSASETIPSTELLSSVDGAARALLADLLDEDWSGLNVDRTVEAETNSLHARAVDTEHQDVRRRLPLAQGQEKETLATRERELVGEKRKMKPHVWNSIRKGG
jgi:hypothetical protein